MPPTERRNPLPATCQYYIDESRKHTEYSVADRLMILENAYNHAVNAAFAEAERLDRLKTDLEILSGRMLASVEAASRAARITNSSTDVARAEAFTQAQCWLDTVRARNWPTRLQS